MLRLYNTLTRRKEPFAPVEPGRAGIYSCGPTVYNLIHIGNLRAGLVSDLFFRCFKRFDCRRGFLLFGFYWNNAFDFNRGFDGLSRINKFKNEKFQIKKGDSSTFVAR